MLVLRILNWLLKVVGKNNDNDIFENKKKFQETLNNIGIYINMFFKLRIVLEKMVKYSREKCFVCS